MPKMSSCSSNSPEAKRWLIVGAYKAGASEKHIARIAGLPKTTVRHIILNYKRTGTPSLPKQEPLRVKDMSVVEYDRDGNLINLEDFENNYEFTHKDCTSDRLQIRSPKLNGKVATKDLISHAEHVRRSELGNPRTSQKTKPTASWCPPTPPRDSKSSPSSTSSSSFLDSPSSSTMSLPISPLFNGIGLEDNAPKTPNTAESPKARKRSKHDQTIQGYEQWTHADDVILLEHVLSSLDGGRWRELESKLQGRHTARLCSERWKYLQRQLLRGVAKSKHKVA